MGVRIISMDVIIIKRSGLAKIRFKNVSDFHNLLQIITTYD
jgi:hypothetical protein